MKVELAGKEDKAHVTTQMGWQQSCRAQGPSQRDSHLKLN